MTDMDRFLPWVALLLNVVIVPLVSRWYAGQIEQMKQQIQLSIAQLKLELLASYATKEELSQVRREIDVAGRVDRGFNNVYRILEAKAKVTEGIVRS